MDAYWMDIHPLGTLHERSGESRRRLRSIAQLMALAALIMLTAFSLIYARGI